MGQIQFRHGIVPQMRAWYLCTGGRKTEVMTPHGIMGGGSNIAYIAYCKKTFRKTLKQGIHNDKTLFTH